MQTIVACSGNCTTIHNVFLVIVTIYLTAFFLSNNVGWKYSVPTLMHRRVFFEKVLLMQHKPLEVVLKREELKIFLVAYSCSLFIDM
jgi:hypothetical protein